jgi:hypothetical protein
MVDQTELILEHRIQYHFSLLNQNLQDLIASPIQTVRLNCFERSVPAF